MIEAILIQLRKGLQKQTRSRVRASMTDESG
jgi:hypothetical protein